MIYDCFPFFNELDMLDIRLHTLNDVVGKFVLVEACFTHTGKPKGFVFEENKSRFAEFADKIIHIKLTEKPDPPSCGTPDERKWFLENFQRNAIVQGLSAAKPTDIIMVSDCDEIPDPKVVAKLPRLHGITHFTPRAYNYYLNVRNYTSPFYGNGTTALSFTDFINPKTYRVFPYQCFVAKCNNPGPSATRVRYLDATRRIRKGWHFSYLGGAEAVRQKNLSIADGNDYGMAVMPIHEIEARICNGEDVFKRGDRFFVEPISKNLPQYVIDNREKFERLLIPLSREQFRSTRVRRLKELLRGFKIYFKRDYLVPTLGPIRRKLKRILSMADDVS